MATRSVGACAVRNVYRTTSRRRARNVEVRRRIRSLAAAWMAAFIAWGCAQGVAQQVAGSIRHLDSQQLFKARLACGEFAPALQQALDSARGPQRDEQFAEIATAQAAAGVVEGFVSALSKIDNDIVRGRVVKTMPLAVLAQFNDPFGPGANANGNAGAPVGNGSRPGQSGSVFQANGNGNPGGGARANFDEVIDLIVSTVEPESWAEIGGPGAINEFAGGVHVDVDGMLSRLEEVEQAGPLQRLRLISHVADGQGERNVRKRSALRKVSLTRLEKAIQLRLAAGRRIDDAMRTLAGLQRVKFVLVYPDTGDLVLAGPAGDWVVDRAGRHVSVESGRPVVELDDLVVILRHLATGPGAEFGCSITPRTKGLARAKAFIEASSVRPIQARRRPRWLEELRSQLGQQDVETFGIPADSHVARVLVEADYHMKLIGIGLADGTQNVPSYLEMLSIPKGKNPPPMDVLRWWFTLNYDALLATPDHLAYELRGQAVRLMSENELLTAQGRRVHTGAVEPLNREFARRFTEHFDALCTMYPVYAALQNEFDLALAAALIVRRGLADRVAWHMTCFADAQQYVPARGIAPTAVDTVINHRVIDRKHVIAAVSGGVHVSPWEIVEMASIEIDQQGDLDSEYQHGRPESDAENVWWWD